MPGDTGTVPEGHTRAWQVPHLVHVVCDLHDALLGVAQVEVLVPVLERGGDGEGSRGKSEMEAERDLGFLPPSTHQGVISNDEELHVLHGPPGISPGLQADTGLSRGAALGSGTLQTPQSCSEETAERGN